MSCGWKRKLSALITEVMRCLPGGELRRCREVSAHTTDCIHHLNHFGKCEDAWRYKWNPGPKL